jgi:hypothetical protein
MLSGHCAVHISAASARPIALKGCVRDFFVLLFQWKGRKKMHEFSNYILPQRHWSCALLLTIMTASSNLVNFLISTTSIPAWSMIHRQCFSRLSCASNMAFMARLSAAVYSTPGALASGFSSGSTLSSIYIRLSGPWCRAGRCICRIWMQVSSSKLCRICRR